MVRRLPVIQTASASDDAVLRPSWRWILFGAGLALALWAALATLLLPLGARVAASMLGPLPEALHEAPLPSRSLAALLTAGPVLVGFALAVGASSYLVVRFGPAAPARRGAAVGLATAGIAWAVTAASGALGTPWIAIFALVVLCLVGAGSGLVAGMVAARRASSGPGGGSPAEAVDSRK